MSFLTPGFFDALVIISIVVGVIAAAIRIYHDFRRGPRWPEAPAPSAEDEQGETDHDRH